MFSGAAAWERELKASSLRRSLGRRTDDRISWAFDSERTNRLGDPAVAVTVLGIQLTAEVRVRKTVGGGWVVDSKYREELMD